MCNTSLYSRNFTHHGIYFGAIPNEVDLEYVLLGGEDEAGKFGGSAYVWVDGGVFSLLSADIELDILEAEGYENGVALPLSVLYGSNQE